MTKEEENKEPEVPVPKPTKENKEPKILVMQEIPQEEIARNAELEGQPVTIETIPEAITEIRNDIREMKKSLTG